MRHCLRRVHPRRAATNLSHVPSDPLSDEQREIRDVVRDLARERIAPRAAEIDKSAEFPWDVVELYREHELLGLRFRTQCHGSVSREAEGNGLTTAGTAVP